MPALGWRAILYGLVVWAAAAAALAAPGAQPVAGSALARGSSPQPLEIADRVSDSIIQIGLASRVIGVDLRIAGSFQAADLASGEKRPLVKGQTYEISSDRSGRVIIGASTFSGAVRLLPASRDDIVVLGERRYRGNILIKPGEGGTVTVVNELGLEEYLYGVLAKEMSPQWPMEALKAQAVVARTWALNNLGKYSELGYDLSNDERSQIYYGLDAESERVRQAVQETAGEVATWRGKLLRVFFHACCGGHTVPASAVWGGADSPKPLRGVRDRHCSGSPYYKWSAYFAHEDILAALHAHGFALARIDSIRPGRRDASGLLKDLRIRSGRKTAAVKANDLRLWLGSTEIKSAQIWRIIRRKKGFEFVGRGYGHGVGLCQWGAFTQAEAGRSYRKILAFYFPGARIVKREE
ncbi:MAG: SpoIID/LytB domain-containing protein [Elusimicrobia bacterium]|nr:SpoIID/LytB domain-containing protein [Elusimicrobiota bacterium]